MTHWRKGSFMGGVTSRNKLFLHTQYYSCIRFISLISSASFFSNLLCMKSIKRPNKTAKTINIVLMIPITEKDILINIVEIINPEFRMTLWNSSV